MNKNSMCALMAFLAGCMNIPMAIINLIYSPQDLNIYNEGDDNSSVSFSYSFSSQAFFSHGEGFSIDLRKYSSLFLNNDGFFPSPFSPQGGT